MCGIGGIVGKLDHDALETMSRRMAHRGPDDAGSWTDPEGGAALVHRRLSIIDTSPLGHQPMENEDGSLVLVANGEIYNHRDLRRSLIARGHRFRSGSDSEVILHLYEEHGPESAGMLDGMFAFALWDRRLRRLFIARDSFGVKPLYFASLPHCFVFASELKAVLAVPGIARDLDLSALHAHLSLIWSPAPRTMLAAVRKLEPGCRLLVDADGAICHSRFSELPFGAPIHSAGRNERAEGTRQRLANAVEAQMMSDVPVGAFLSGGLDSSAVVALMRRRQGEPVPCYTIAIEGDADENPDDLPYARLVAKALDVTLHEVPVQSDVIAATVDSVYQLDEPLADPAALNVALIARAARADGVKVLLSGAGGDDIFGGYRRHLALAVDQWTGRLPTAWRGAAAEAVIRLGQNRATADRAWTRRLAKYTRDLALDGDERLLAHFVWHPSEIVDRLYHPDLRAEIGPKTTAGAIDAVADLRANLARIPDEHHPLNRMLFLETVHFLADHNLVYTDRMSMLHGVEVRVPFLDRELVSYAARLPIAAKQHGTTLKGVLRDAFEPMLPAEVLRRRKTGFGAPLRRWIRHELRDLVRDTLDSAVIARRGLFDPVAVSALVEANEAGTVDASYLVYSLVCIELWLGRFVDR